MKNINIDKTIIIKYVTYDYENGDSEVFDSKLLIVSSYEDLSDQIKSYYASCLDSEFFTMVSENDSKYIHHADTNQPIESYLLAYKNLSEAENDDEFNRIIYNEKIYIGERVRDLKYNSKNKKIFIGLNSTGSLGIISRKEK